jgi:hypothetical protein
VYPDAVHPLRAFASHAADRTPARQALISAKALVSFAKQVRQIRGSHHCSCLNQELDVRFFVFSCLQRSMGAARPSASQLVPKAGWASDRVSDTLMWGVTFPEPVPVSSIKLYWEGCAPRTFSVEVTTDPLPDLAAAVRSALPVVPANLAATPSAAVAASGDAAINPDEDIVVPPVWGSSTAEVSQKQREDPALRNLVLLSSPAVATVASSLQAVVCSTPADETGAGSTSEATVSPLAPVNAGAPSPPAMSQTVTWRVVHRAVVSDSEALPSNESVTHDVAARPHSLAPVGGASSSVPDCSRITGLRVVLKGLHRLNTRNTLGIAAVQLMTPQVTSGCAHSPPLSIIRNLQVCGRASALIAVVLFTRPLCIL